MKYLLTLCWQPSQGWPIGQKPSHVHYCRELEWPVAIHAGERLDVGRGHETVNLQVRCAVHVLSHEAVGLLLTPAKDATLPDDYGRKDEVDAYLERLGFEPPEEPGSPEALRDAVQAAAAAAGWEPVDFSDLPDEIRSRAREANRQAFEIIDRELAGEAGSSPEEPVQPASEPEPPPAEEAPYLHEKTYGES